jgi:hypothetical protein
LHPACVGSGLGALWLVSGDFLMIFAYVELREGAVRAPSVLSRFKTPRRNFGFCWIHECASFRLLWTEYLVERWAFGVLQSSRLFDFSWGGKKNSTALMCIIVTINLPNLCAKPVISTTRIADVSSEQLDQIV